MAKLILFENPVPYKWVKEAFVKAIDEYLPITKFDTEGETFAWEKYLKYFTEHKTSYITDRVSDIRFKEVCTYLEFIAIPNQPLFHLYDGIERAQHDVRIFDDYPIKGIFIAPEMKDAKQNSNKPYPNEEGLANFIKTIVDTHYALESAKETPNVWLGVFKYQTKRGVLLTKN